MKNTILSVLYILQKNRINKQGLCPIRCRITYNKKRKMFSTGLFVVPKHWHNKQQLAKPPTEKHDFINNQLSLIKTQINQAFLFLQVSKEQFDVEDIYLKYSGKDTQETKTVLALFQEHNDKVEKLIGIEYVLPTLWKFKQARVLLKDFIKFQYSKN